MGGGGAFGDDVHAGLLGGVLVGRGIGEGLVEDGGDFVAEWGEELADVSVDDDYLSYSRRDDGQGQVGAGHDDYDVGF